MFCEFTRQISTLLSDPITADIEDLFKKKNESHYFDELKYDWLRSKSTSKWLAETDVCTLESEGKEAYENFAFLFSDFEHKPQVTWSFWKKDILV